MTTVYGVPLSPFVRKVLFVLEHNGVEHDLDPVIPMDLPEGFHELSPLGKIPAFKDDELTISDSSVICGYLDAKYGEPGGKSLYPSSRADRAKALWFEEYADTKLVELLGGGLFFERVIKPKFLQEETDTAKVEDTLTNGLPPVLDYLESQTPESGFLLGDQLTIADVAIASPFINALYAEYQVDGARWPKFSAFLQRMLSSDGFQQRLAAEKAMMSA